MKNRFFIITALCAALPLGGCGEGALGAPPVSPSRYALRLPAIPPAWASMLGAPRWRIEWLNREGLVDSMTVQGGSPEIGLYETMTSPVSAWPYWPDRGIVPGVFKPAGALFPFDVSAGTITLSWRGGVDAALYRELAKEAAASRAPVSRLPQHFNWPRFRKLFAGESGVNADVRADPWLADWAAIAQKIVRSGFDKRRLVPETRGELRVPVGPGPWAGTSPFAEPLRFEGTPAFPVRPVADTWVSAGGMLHCNSETWILLPWD